MGTRTSRTHFRMPLKDHPHAYGDKRMLILRVCVLIGSSPRVWGQVKAARDKVHDIGIIPTRMGTRPILSINISSSEDHPHAYGDKSIKVLKGCNTIGSSPRVWGQAIFANRMKALNRIIPTRMGTSFKFQNILFKTQDHPHAYGDKVDSSY